MPGQMRVAGQPSLRTRQLVDGRQRHAEGGPAGDETGQPAKDVAPPVAPGNATCLADGQVDLAAAGISTVLWTTGYRLSYPWLELPILDEFGFPLQRRGVTEVPGLYFLGLLWQHNQGSATLFGVGPDLRHIAEHMGLPLPDDLPVPA